MADSENFTEPEKESSVQWEVIAWAEFVAPRHPAGFRLATQDFTRVELQGPFLRDYFFGRPEHAWLVGWGYEDRQLCGSPHARSHYRFYLGAKRFEIPPE
ncbi:MAG: hypothetical protein U0V70_21850 [Terriglobia bacterium]